MGHDAHRDPENYQMKMPDENMKFSKHQQVRVEHFKAKPFGMKAPDETKSVGPGKLEPLSWLDAEVIAVQYQRKLKDFLKSDTVMQVIKKRLLGQFAGSMSHLSIRRTVADDNTALSIFRREANMVPGSFEPEYMFTLVFDRITTLLESLHKQ